MTTTLRFRDHEEFHRAAWQMAAAGAVAGIGGHAVFGSLAAPETLALMATAACAAALPAAARTARAFASTLVLAALAAAALVVLPRQGHPDAGIGLFAALYAAGLARGTAGRRVLAAIGTGAATAVLARAVVGSIAGAQELSSLPPWLVAALGGGAFAFVSVLALLVRHVDLGRDRVAESYTAVMQKAQGEVRELCQRGNDLWRKVAEALPEDDANRRTLEDAVLRLYDVARRWHTAEADGAQSSATSLVDRMEALDKRIADTDDTVAKGQYQNARGALAEQLRYLKDIGRSRDRVLARMHNYLATMERLRLAVVNLRSADASRAVDSVQPIVNDLQELGRDIDCSSEALVEVDRAPAAPTPAPTATPAVEQADAADAAASRPTAQA